MKGNSIFDRIKNSKAIIGVLLVLLSTVFFTTSTTLLKLGSQEVDSFHLMFWRTSVGLLIVLSIGIKRKRVIASFKELTKPALFWLVVRGVIGGMTMFCYFTALSLGDIGEIGAFHKLNPIFTVIFAYFLLKEGLSLKLILAVVIAVIGVFLIRNPFTAGFSLAHLLVILAAIGTGFVAICVRKLKLLKVDSWFVVLFLLVGGLIISTPKVIIDSRLYELETFIFVIGAGIASTLGQLLTTSAAKYINAGKKSILSLLTIFEFMIIGYVIFDENINHFDVIGGVLITIATTLIVMSTVIFNKAKKPLT